LLLPSCRSGEGASCMDTDIASRDCIVIVFNVCGLGRFCNFHGNLCSCLANEIQCALLACQTSNFCDPVGSVGFCAHQRRRFHGNSGGNISKLHLVASHTLNAVFCFPALCFQ
jgi:hypothetical protein